MNTEVIDAEGWYRLYGPMVLRRCRSLLSREKQALDVMQDIFTRIQRRRGALGAGNSRRPLCGIPPTDEMASPSFELERFHQTSDVLGAQTGQ